MPDDFVNDAADEVIRYECPNCGKGFDVAGNKWERGDLICPYCGVEIEGE